MVRKAIAPGPIAGLIALAAALFMLAGGSDFCLDDAWIHLAYAKSLRLGDGISYNPGDHETGFSSPLWMLLISVLPWGGGGSDPVTAVKLLGALCHVALAWGAAELTGALTAGRSVVSQPSPRTLAAVAGVLCAVDPALTFAAVSGMEVSLTAALIAWTLWATIRGRLALAAALAACAVWARPESLLFLAAWSGLRFAADRKRASLVPLVAAGAALAVWAVYCLAVSGYPFPNTYYAKRDARLGIGVLYFIIEYLPQHAWAVGLSGLVLVAFATARAGEPRRLVLAWLVACIAIAGTREIVPHVLFYCWRYFAVLGAVPIVALVAMLPERRWLMAVSLIPIALASAWMLPRARDLQRGQEHDIHLVHTEPAHWLASTIPRNARILLEGAGAARFFLPREVRIIDANGLNLRTVVHGANVQERICAAVRLEPEFVSLPSNLFAIYEQVLKLQTLREFVAPGYRIVDPPRPERVIAARVVEITRRVRVTCRFP